MKIVIVEDETIAFEYLEGLITRIDPTIEILAATESISQTVHWMKNHPSPDLILMDIHLSDGSAFNIFEAVQIETPIIFTTAYDEYAIQAFQVNSIDYLLKPIEEEALRKALNKFRKLSSPEKQQYIRQQAETNYTGSYPTRLLVAWRDNLIPVPVKEIICFYTTDHQTHIYMADGKQYIYNKTLDSIYQTLDPNQFFRANKQFIIAREQVKNITIWFDRRLLVTLRIEVPERIYISKNKASEFKEWMTNG